MLKIFINEEIGKQFEEEVEEQTYLQLRNIEMNVQMEAKLASFTVGEESQLNIYQAGQNLHVYAQ